jgi:hypothetical protein
MKVQHVFNGHIYLISNHAVACNSIFENSELCTRFLEKVDLYLSPLCEILHYVLHDNQFQLLVKIASKEAFIKYYRNKKGEKIKEKDIPFSTHLFSQAVANLLASTAIHYNRKYNRTGALFARRFTKTLMTNEEIMKSWVEGLHSMRRYHRYGKRWRSRKSKKRRYGCVQANNRERNAQYFYSRRSLRHPILSSFKRVHKLDLQGQFKILPPPSIYTIFSCYKTVQYLKIKPDIP